MRATSLLRAGVALVLLAVAGLVARCERAGAPAVEPGAAAIEEAFAQRRSDLWVEVSGTVSRSLADDRDGSRHQRFVLELDTGRTVLVAHNIDLAPRVPLQVGDRLTVRGEYEWNERGGVMHWTHRDPDDRHDGGWVRHDGRLYR